MLSAWCADLQSSLGRNFSSGDTAMSMIHSAAGMGYTTDSNWRVFSFLARCLVVFRESRSRRTQLAELPNPNDRALQDIGVTRSLTCSLDTEPSLKLLTTAVAKPLHLR